VILHDNGTVVDISGYTFAAIATADGYYHLTLQSGISNTVGHMTVVINDDSLCLPVKAEFTVVEETIYDALFAASANAWTGAAGASIVTANTTQFAGQAVTCAAPVTVLASVGTAATSTAQTGDAYARLGAPAGASVSADVAAVKTQTAAIETDTGTDLPATLATIAGYLDTEVAAIKAKTDSLTFTTAGQVDANVQSVNDVALQGDGTAGNSWRPV
jgi:hypothetical protein